MGVGESGALLETLNEVLRRGVPLEPQAHEQLLAYLDRHRDVYWTAPFVDIARWVRDHPPGSAGPASP